MKRKDICNAVLSKISRVSSHEEAVAHIEARMTKADAPMVLSFINAHGFNLCFQNEAYRQALVGSDLLLRDGKGMELLFRSIGADVGVNCCGTDLIPFLLAQLADRKVALVGTTDPYLSRAALNLRTAGIDVVLCCDGFRDQQFYLSELERTRPDVVVMGMGNPRQELVSDFLKGALSYAPLMINGGAIIDYLGAKVSRAPEWMRRQGFEWLYRFLLEPRRLFRRYVFGNAAFLYRLMLLYPGMLEAMEGEEQFEPMSLGSRLLCFFGFSRKF